MDKKKTKQNYIKEASKDKIFLSLWEESRESLSYKLREFIYYALVETYSEIIDKIGLKDIVLSHPQQENFGDYSTNIAFITASRLKKPPREIAEKISAKINKTLESREEKKSLKTVGKVEQLRQVLEKSEVAGGGFINLWLRNQYFSTELVEVLDKNFGDRITQIITKNVGLGLWGNKIMIEYAHPNTHKEFHIGHLRNISIGESLVRILEVCGAKVFRANYQGDVGLHVAKAIWGVKNRIKNYELRIKNQLKIKNEEKKEKVLNDLRKLTPVEKAKFLGEGYALGNKAYEEDPLAKKEIIELNKEIYKNPKDVELWEETRSWSLEYFDWIYRRLGSHFDRLFFESEVEERGRQLVLDNIKTGIFKKDKDGSVYFPGSHYGLNDCVFVTRENYATYEGKDVALEDLEFQIFPYDLDIHNVANEQKNFFQIAFAALYRIFPYQKGRQYHLAYGMVNLKGGKLSSRTGEVVTADWLIEEAKKRIGYIIKGSSTGKLGLEYPLAKHSKSDRSLVLVQAEIEDVSEKVAVGAVKYSMLKVNPKMDIAFDLEESVSLDGDSGPYLQYTYARCKSVLRKSKDRTYHNTIKVYQNISSFGKLRINDEEMSLMRTFHRFPEVVVEAGRSLSSNLICNYLFDLAQKYNLFYNKYSILNPQLPNESSDVGKEQITQFRLALTQATANIIQKGLYLLGIETVERM